MKIGAEEQARMLLDLNILLDGANEQAQMLFEKEQNEAMLEDARKEALNIQRLNTLIDDDKFEEMAEKATKGGKLDTSYVPLNKEDVIKIYRMCL